MDFDFPESFLLLPLLALVGWFWLRLGLFRPLRLVILILAVAMLSGPNFVKQQNALELIVLLDRSDSTEDLIDKSLPEWTRLLEESKPGRKDKLRFVNYAAEVADAGIDGSSFTGSRKQTRTGLALSNLMAQVDEKMPTRVLLFTDGYSTEPLNEAAEQMKKRGVPLDYRLVREETIEDARVARLQFPERVQVGEPFLISVLVRSNKDEAVPLVIKRNGQTLVETDLVIKEGVGTAEFTDRLAQVGAFEYEAEIRPEVDAHLGNNRIKRWLEITGGPRLLLVTKYEDDPVALAMADMDFDVQVIKDTSQLKPGMLGGTKAVIFNNVPAHQIPNDFMKSLDFFVREQGGGFMMVGGKHSFGAGGYFQSDIDELLPVSMELKSEHRKLAVALAIVMDRSGSMGVEVGGGKTKMDLADSGAIAAVNLLGAMDQITVFAVDSEAKKIVPLSAIGGNQAKINHQISRISSGGGGIYVHTGLKAGWEELRKSKAGTRHLILFTDTQDTEEPGDYKKLIDEMTREGATISVIGMGTKADCDAALCEDIAKLGKGRIFFSDRPMDIPQIFAQETVTIARSAFLEEKVSPLASGRWSEISPKPMDWMSVLGGYNLSYARKDTTVSLVSKDEYVAPLVAHARRGLGRTAAVSFPLSGDYSEDVRNWKGYGDFVQTMGRFLMGEQLPPGLAIRHQLKGTRLELNLYYDPEVWGDRLNQDPPVVKLQDEALGAIYDIPWRRIAPGQFSLSRDLNEGSLVKGAIRVGDHALAFGPVSVGSSVEWAFESERLEELRQVSHQTNGRKLLNLEDAWLRPPYLAAHSLSLPLGISLLIMIVLEALVTRTGWKMPEFFRSKHDKIKFPKPLKARAPKVSKPVMPEVHREITEPVIEEDSERRSRFQKAKNKK
jgi:uncharacterized membrane protein